MGMILIIGGFLLFGLIGRAIALSIYDLFFPPKKEDKYTFIDNSIILSLFLIYFMFYVILNKNKFCFLL